MICAAICIAMLIPSLYQTAQAQTPGQGAPKVGAPKTGAAKPGTPGPGVPATQQPMVSCQRGGLQHAVRLYLAAQANGDISVLPLSNGFAYQENYEVRRHQQRLPYQAAGY
jgi:hypothetical protein